MASLSNSLDELMQSIDTVIEKNKLQEEVIDKQNNTIFYQQSIIEEKDSIIKHLTEILEKQLSEQNHCTFLLPGSEFDSNSSREICL